jgi:uncharacterized protein (TIGR03435 family)
MSFRGAKMLGALLLSACAAVPQTFEAASVKPAEEGLRRLGPLRGGPRTSSPGQLMGTATLKVLVMRAYGLKDYQVIGPPWIDSQRYEIAAKIPGGATLPQVALMWRSLLAERFGLAAHHETKELPLFALVVGKSGAKLQVSDQDAASAEAANGTQFTPKFTQGADGLPDMPGGSKIPRSFEIVRGGSDAMIYKLWARRETMEQLADRLSAQLNRPVIDRTELKDAYDFVLTWAMETTGGGIPRTGPPPDEIDMDNGPILSEGGSSIFNALPAQLGLRLEPRRGPLEMLVVDKAEKIPTGN